MNGRDASGRPVSLLNGDASFSLNGRSPTVPLPLQQSHDLPPSSLTPNGLPARGVSSSRYSSSTPDLQMSGDSSSSQRSPTESTSPGQPYAYQVPPLPHIYTGAPSKLPGSSGYVVRASQSPEYSQSYAQRGGHTKSVVRSTAQRTSPGPSHAAPNHQSPRTPKTPNATAGGTSSAGSSPTRGPAKRFPCQFAASTGCTDTFTTSGHASRHAKKHTGERGVPCPICGKGFARKDNMKQHLKTHDRDTQENDTQDNDVEGSVSSGHNG
ncbi:MAG: hypothetical protein M1825_004264 [Sarcosagium campestre]|nr:MAG: hypothetical protein M1825_004264 [Sarcosagium campestre]